MIKTRLQAKVEARNLSNAAALEWGPRIIAALVPFIGKDIKTQDGGKTVKVQKAIAALGLPASVPANGQLQIVVRADSFWFRAEFRTRIDADDSCVYETTTVNLGDINGKELIRVSERVPAFRTDYDAREIYSARAAVQSLRREANIAERRLEGFGEHDN